MEQDQNIQQSASKDPKGVQVNVGDTDPLLVEMLNEMEAFGFSYNLTLTMHGFLISGTPIFLAEYLEILGIYFQRAAQASVDAQDDSMIAEAKRGWGETLRTRYNQAAEVNRLPDAPEGDAEAEKQRWAAQERILKAPREHVILKRVSIIHPSGEQLDVPLWRGRLTHIAGWSLGRTQQHDYLGLNLTDSNTD